MFFQRFSTREELLRFSIPGALGPTERETRKQLLQWYQRFAGLQPQIVARLEDNPTREYELGRLDERGSIVGPPRSGTAGPVVKIPTKTGFSMNAPPLLNLEIRLSDVWPPEAWRDVTVLLAVSGGADSVALLRAMRSLKKAGPGRLLAAHFNHGLRAEESDADETFVVELCRRCDVPCEVGRAAGGDSLSARGGEGLEAAARRVRYNFLRQTAARVGARYVVTAHTADDQVETILHRILRGTGIAGLAGMARCRPLGEATTLIRPLLGVRRAELIAYLEPLGQPYRTDSSNTDTRLTRNRLRHELLPQLAERYNPAIDEALLRLGSLAGEVQAVVDRLVLDLAERNVIERDGATDLDAASLAEKPRYLIRELFMHVWRSRDWPLQAMGYAEWDQLAEMLLAAERAKTTKMFPGGVTARRDGDRLWLRRENEAVDR